MRLRKNPRILDQFNASNMQSEMRNSSRFLAKKFSRKMTILLKLLDNEIRLTGIYLNNIEIKKLIGSVYEDNIVVNNTLLNLPYLGNSIMLLTENTLYGSARVLLRQFFEYLILGKFSEFNREIIFKWKNKIEKDRRYDINLSNDALNKIPKNVVKLKELWRELCEMTHPTKYAQQVPRFPASTGKKRNKEIQQTRKATNFEPDVHYTLDLLFVLLCMNYHLLISNWGRKSYRWYLGYYQDPMGIWKREKAIKSQSKALMHAYFIENKKFKNINGLFKRIIFEYRQNWKVSE